MIPRFDIRPPEAHSEILLVMGATPASDWERTLPLFEQAGCTFPREPLMKKWIAAMRAPLGRRARIAILDTADQDADLVAATEALLNACTPPVVAAIDGGDLDELLGLWEREIRGTHLLLLHARPEAPLAQAMHDGREPEEVLTQWEAAAERVLEAYRRNRSRISLMDVDCVLAAPNEFLRTCKPLLGVDPGRSGSHRTISKPIAAPANPAGIHHLIASQMVIQNPRIGGLIAELEASSLPIGEESAPAPIDCGKVYHDHQEWQARIEEIVRERDEVSARLRDKEARLEEREEERDHDHQAWQARIESVTRERDEVSARLQDKEARLQQREEEREEERDHDHQAWQARIEEIVRERDEVSARLRDREARLEEMERDNQLILLQSHQVQEELESYYLQFQSTNEKLRCMEGSRSWRITSPMRVAMGFFRGTPSAGGAGKA